MSKSARPRAADLLAVARLSHECRDLGDDPAGWRLHLAKGLARLAGAGIVTVEESAFDGWPPALPQGRVIGIADYGWDHGFDRTLWPDLLARFQEIGAGTVIPMFIPYLAVVTREDGAARSRADLVSDRDWYGSDYYQTFQRQFRTDAMLYSLTMLPGRPNVGSLLVFVRPTGEQDFTPRQKAVVRAAHALVAPLIGGPLARFADPSPADLPPRCREVLRCLLQGDSDKQTAARLGLSQFTVNEYTKRVFRHFGVNTRAELLARWVSRGWGGRCAWADPE